MNHFESFAPANYCQISSRFVGKEHCCDQDYLAVPLIINPKISLRQLPENKGYYASIDNLNLTLYDTTDLLWWAKKKQAGNVKDEDIIHGIKGVMGERLLSLVMEYFLTRVSQVFSRFSQSDFSKIAECSFGVLRERGHLRGKGYIARFNEEYLLRFKGLNNFVILKKNHRPTTEESYQQEMFGLLSTEIDGLGYLHAEGEKYLLVGESSTKNEFNINAMNKQRHPLNDVNERVFAPLRSLFPEHHLVYFVMSSLENLLDQNIVPARIKDAPKKVHVSLAELGINTIFSPFPELKPSLLEISTEIVSSHASVMETLGDKLKMEA